MASNETNWNGRLSFPSNMTRAHELIEQMLVEVDRHAWPDKERFAVQLALEEAFVNAVNHGNKTDPAKQVHFSWLIERNLIRFQVEDEGEGFDPDSVPDPTDEEHIMVASGRGVLLIRGFMDRVDFNEKGNSVFMEKTRKS